MGKHPQPKNGITALLKRGRRTFRVPENLAYYSEEDLKIAEKKFLSLCVIGGKCHHRSRSV